MMPADTSTRKKLRPCRNVCRARIAQIRSSIMFKHNTRPQDLTLIHGSSPSFPNLLWVVRNLCHPTPRTKALLFSIVALLQEADPVVNVVTNAAQATKENTIDADGEGARHFAWEVQPIPRECGWFCFKTVHVPAVVVEHDRALQYHVQEVQTWADLNRAWFTKGISYPYMFRVQLGDVRDDTESDVGAVIELIKEATVQTQLLPPEIDEGLKSFELITVWCVQDKLTWFIILAEVIPPPTFGRIL